MKPDPTTEVQQQDTDWVVRQRARERRKLIGLIVVALFILVLAFVRFSRTIPWGAR